MDCGTHGKTDTRVQPHACVRVTYVEAGAVVWRRCLECHHAERGKWVGGVRVAGGPELLHPEQGGGPMTGRERALTGCWHYDYAQHCVQCDPATYGTCEPDCAVEHEHCTCATEGHATCAVHEDEASCEEEEA